MMAYSLSCNFRFVKKTQGIKRMYPLKCITFKAENDEDLSNIFT